MGVVDSTLSVHATRDGTTGYNNLRIVGTLGTLAN